MRKSGDAPGAVPGEIVKRADLRKQVAAARLRSLISTTSLNTAIMRLTREFSRIPPKTQRSSETMSRHGYLNLLRQRRVARQLRTGRAISSRVSTAALPISPRRTRVRRPRPRASRRPSIPPHRAPHYVQISTRANRWRCAYASPPSRCCRCLLSAQDYARKPSVSSLSSGTNQSRWFITSARGSFRGEKIKITSLME